MDQITTNTVVEPRHDFVSKLKSPALLPAVLSYVNWRRAVLAARRKNAPEPAMPSGFVPPAIQLDLTTACNSACPGCIDREILNRKETHDYLELTESLRYMADRGLSSVILIGGGEPTIHPRFRDVVRLLKERGIQVGIVSNGLYSVPLLEVASELHPPDWVRISLDAGTNSTFQALRRPRNRMTLEEVCAGVSRIRERNQTLSLGFSFVVSWPGTTTEHGEPIAENINEMVTAAELARAHGFSYLSFKAYLTRAMTGSEVIDPAVIEKFETVIEDIRAQVVAAKKLETEHFEVSLSRNLRVMLDGGWKRLMDQPRTCHKQALQWVISPLGTFNCPAYRGVAKARITDPAPWASGKECATREAVAGILDRFDAHAECARTVCFYNDMNWWIEDLVNSKEIPIPTEVAAADCFL